MLHGQMICSWHNRRPPTSCAFTFTKEEISLQPTTMVHSTRILRSPVLAPEQSHRRKFPPPHQSGKSMVCGHTSQPSGLPVNLGHAICIDTWVYGDGWLTALDVGSGRYWQTNERGGRREDEIGTLLR